MVEAVVGSNAICAPTYSTHLTARANSVSARDKRLTYIFCFCAGAAIGGAMYRYSGTAAPIFLAGGVKLCVTVSYLFNPSKQQSPLSPALLSEHKPDRCADEARPIG